MYTGIGRREGKGREGECWWHNHYQISMYKTKVALVHLIKGQVERDTNYYSLVLQYVTQSFKSKLGELVGGVILIAASTLFLWWRRWHWSHPRLSIIDRYVYVLTYYGVVFVFRRFLPSFLFFFSFLVGVMGVLGVLTLLAAGRGVYIVFISYTPSNNPFIFNVREWRRRTDG